MPVPVPTSARFKNLTGKVFGRLTVTAYAGKRGARNHRWHCTCSCGNTVIVGRSNLTSGNTRSCGCLNSEVSAQRATTHGQTGTYLHRLWGNIKTRCSNPNLPRYRDWGGRGISMHRQWAESFSEFSSYVLSELGDRPSAKHSLDRIDNDGNYEPGNVRWATRSQQNSNARNFIRGRPAVQVEYSGRSMSLGEWASEVGIKYATLRYRLVVGGWDMGRALTEASRQRTSTSQ